MTSEEAGARSTSCPSGSRRGPGECEQREDAACVKGWCSHVVGSHVVVVVTTCDHWNNSRGQCDGGNSCRGQVAVAAATTVVDDDSFDNCVGH